MMSESTAARGRARARVVAAFLLLFLAVPATVVQAQTGKLAGRIVDEAGEPVISATAFVLGTELGAAADLNGDYSILRIPPGTYSVRFSSVGYQTTIVENVLITSNQTTELDVTLAEEVIEGEEVVVTAERPVVDITLTSSMQSLSREEISVLPVQRLDDIVNLQAGVVDGHFRGGRQGEVQYQVDGVSVNNPYDNQSSLRLDRSVLQEVQVISGTFDAEYGQAMSGVVNAVLRSGDEDRYEFSGEVYLGDFYSPGNDSTVVQTRFDTLTVGLLPHISDIDPTTFQNYQFSLSGPVPLAPSTTFLVNGQRFVDMGHLMGERLFLPTDSADFENRVFTPSGDQAVVPLNFTKQWSWLAKVTNRSIRNVQLGYQVITNVIDRQGYNHGFRFNPEGLSPTHQFSIVHGLDLQHALNATTFYEASVRQNYFDYRDMKYEDLGTPPEGAGVQYALPP
ncbi:MAG TPA: carboxypeptidase-like regulatory domain-containing protein, partial [Rhodothermales bacterium]